MRFVVWMAWGVVFGLALSACKALFNSVTGADESLAAALVWGAAFGVGMACFSYWVHGTDR